MHSPLPLFFAALGTLAYCVTCAGVALAEELPTGAARENQRGEVLANQKGSIRPIAPEVRPDRGRRPVDIPSGQPARYDPAVEPATFERSVPSADDPQPASQPGRPSPPQKGEPLAISPPASTSGSKSGSSVSSSQSLLTVAISLAVVLGLFFLLAWLLRRGMPKGGQSLPTDVLEMLGRTPLPGRQHLQLLRFGNKLLLVSLAPGVAETLAEISDPAEIDRLVGLCQQSRSGSATAAFRNMLKQISSDRKSTKPAGTLPETSDDPRSVREMLEEHDA